MLKIILPIILGIYTAVDGSRYEGKWKEDMKEGKGKCIWSNGDMYEGHLKQDKFHGKGNFIKLKNFLQERRVKSTEYMK